MRIAIVNDLPMAVEVLRRTLASDPDYQLAWIAVDGAEALRKCAEDTPDLVLMDLVMPVMDGCKACQAIMARSPCAILIVTASVSANSAKVFEAMGYGALDAVATPVWGADGQITGTDALLRKIANIRKRVQPGPDPAREARCGASPFVAIGASTGGPRALVRLLGDLPPQPAVPVLVAQHIDAALAPNLAQWMDQHTPLHVVIAADGMRPSNGTVFVAGTNDHMILDAEGALRYTAHPRDCPFRPSADALFHSLARNALTAGVAVLLTGMGRDGARGLLALRNLGWHTIAQDEPTCVVYGMPKAAVALGAACDVLPIDRIGRAVGSALRRMSGAATARPGGGPQKENRT